MPRRSRTFGSVAAAYEQFRLGYPDELVTAILEFAGRPVRTALEIGAGTGKATRAFAARGVAVTATDPDAAMLAELRRQVPDSVVTLEAAFEEVPLTARYDLVFAAAALHWTDPTDRWTRVAALLEPQGSFASFGGQMFIADPGLDEAVRAARAPWLGDDAVPSPDGTSDEGGLRWPGTELAASTLFVDVRQSVIERRSTMFAGDYVRHLGTVSAYLELPPEDRQSALARIEAVLPEVVELTSDLTLHLARSA
ncbi:class I SAM-dependent methyltransferase [soil metagenome]